MRAALARAGGEVRNGALRGRAFAAPGRCSCIRTPFLPPHRPAHGGRASSSPPAARTDPFRYPARRDPPVADIRQTRQTARDQRARLLAREPERHCLLGFDRPQAALLAADIVARHRSDALPLGDLDLEIHHRLLAERLLGGGEIELAHAHEALIVETLDFLAVGE